MEWYVFALLAPAFWAMNNVFVKFLITNKFKRYFPLIATIVLSDTIFAIVVSILTPISVYVPYSIFAFLIGLMPLLALWFYSKALIIEEVTRIATLFQIILVFVVLLSVVFLGEILGMRQYVGIGLTVLASMLISYKKSSEKSFFSALKFMIPFGIIMAAFTISNKFLLRYLDFWSMFFWNALGTCCGVIFLLSRSGLRKEFAESITIDGKKAIFLTFVGEGLFVIGTISSLAALSLADASLVSALFNTQLFYVFLYTLFLSLLLPKILKEEINKSTTSLKIFAIALMFIGTWLVI